MSIVFLYLFVLFVIFIFGRADSRVDEPYKLKAAFEVLGFAGFHPLDRALPAGILPVFDIDQKRILGRCCFLYFFCFLNFLHNCPPT